MCRKKVSFSVQDSTSLCVKKCDKAAGSENNLDKHPQVYNTDKLYYFKQEVDFLKSFLASSILE